MYEIELCGFYDADGNFIEHCVIPATATCSTELTTLAYSLQKEYRAEFVTFGLAIERFEDGSPAYPKTAQKRRA